MKKLAFIVIGASALMYLSSCGEKSNTEPKQEDSVQASTIIDREALAKEISLTTPTDSLSYAMGVNYFEWSGLNTFIKQPQRNLIIDTVSVYSTYVYKINSTSNKDKKKELIVEMRSKIDSICKENADRLALFSKGIKDVMATSDDKQDAYNLGVSIGVGLKTDILAIYTKEIFGDSEEGINAIDKDIFIAVLSAAINGEKVRADESRELVAKTKAKMRD